MCTHNWGDESQSGEIFGQEGKLLQHLHASQFKPGKVVTVPGYTPLIYLVESDCCRSLNPPHRKPAALPPFPGQNLLVR
jgi:hypothetical protein